MGVDPDAMMVGIGDRAVADGPMGGRVGVDSVGGDTLSDSVVDPGAQQKNLQDLPCSFVK